MPETLEYGVSSFVLRERRPFHPQRLMTAIPSKGMKAVVRSKGFVWLASHPNHTFLWSQAGKQLSLNPQGPWQCLGALRHSSSSCRTLIRERLTHRTRWCWRFSSAGRGAPDDGGGPGLVGLDGAVGPRVGRSTDRVGSDRRAHGPGAGTHLCHALSRESHKPRR